MAVIHGSNAGGGGDRGAPPGVALRRFRSLGPDRVPLLVLLVGLALYLVPLFAARLLPLLDQPNHLAAAAVWHNLRDKSWGMRPYYMLNVLPVPYLAYYLPVNLLAYVVSLELANKLVLAAYAVALPLSLLALARRLGRSPWLAVLSLPLIYNYDLAYGFLPFVVALPPLLGCLAWADLMIDRPAGPRAGDFWGVLGLSCLCYFGHVMAWVFLGLCAGALLLLHLIGLIAEALRTGRLRWVGWLSCVLALLPSVALALWGLRLGAQAEVAVASQVKKGVELDMVYLTRKEQWDTLAQRFLLCGQGPGVKWLLWLGLGTLLVLHLSTRWRRRPADATPGLKPSRWAAEVYMLMALAAALLIPFTLRKPFHWWNVGPRFFCVAALFAVLTVRRPLRGRWQLLLVPALCGVLVYPLWLTAAFRSFNQRAGGAARILDRLPRGSQVLVLPLGDRSDPAVDREVVPYTEFQSWAQVLVGGFNHVGWKMNFPYRILWPRTPPTPHWAYPESFSQAVHGARHDYVLTFREGYDYQIFADNPDWRRRVPLTARDGEWRLYRTRDIK